MIKFTRAINYKRPSQTPEISFLIDCLRSSLKSIISNKNEKTFQNYLLLIRELTGSKELVKKRESSVNFKAVAIDGCEFFNRVIRKNLDLTFGNQTLTDLDHFFEVFNFF